MIKGINKQIIEIRCTDDEYFDKVLLFVRADKANLPQGMLQKGADNFCTRLFRTHGGSQGGGRRAKLALLLISLTGVMAFLGYLLYTAV